MKKRNFLLVFLVFLFVSLTGLSFAYWDNLNKTESNTVNIGAGTEVVVNAVATVPTGKTLVPSSALLGPNDVNQIVLTYNVRVSKEIAQTVNLTVTVENVLIGGEATNAGLVNIVIFPVSPTVITTTDTLITVTVTLSEPTTSEIATAIMGQPITFDLTFEGAAA